MVLWWIIQALVIKSIDDSIRNNGRSGMKKLDRNMDLSLNTIQNMLMLGNSDFGIPTMKEIKIIDNIAFATE